MPRELRHVACAALLVTAGTAIADDGHESRADAWWTGPLLAPNAATLPQGRALIEPYLFNVITNGHIDADGNRQRGPNAQQFGSLSYMLYGVTDRLTAGFIPRVGYLEPAGAPDSSGVGFGDLTLQAGYGLLRYHDGGSTPDLSLVLQETLPTGRYDHLGRLSDGFGSGTYATTVALYSQDYFWLPNGRILRARLDLSYAFSSSVSVAGLSVYGTPSEFSGRAYPGDAFTVDAAGEYSMTRNWVLALDVVYQHGASTSVTGSVTGSTGTVADAWTAASGSSWSLVFAPAIEYNFSGAVGVIFGVRVIEIGRNTTATVTPAIAVNMVL